MKDIFKPNRDPLAQNLGISLSELKNSLDPKTIELIEQEIIKAFKDLSNQGVSLEELRDLVYRRLLSGGEKGESAVNAVNEAISAFVQNKDSLINEVESMEKSSKISESEKENPKTTLNNVLKDLIINEGAEKIPTTEITLESALRYVLDQKALKENFVGNIKNAMQGAPKSPAEDYTNTLKNAIKTQIMLMVLNNPFMKEHLTNPWRVEKKKVSDVLAVLEQVNQEGDLDPEKYDLMKKWLSKIEKNGKWEFVLSDPVRLKKFIEFQLGINPKSEEDLDAAADVNRAMVEAEAGKAA
jgi:hypothetical protein